MMNVDPGPEVTLVREIELRSQLKEKKEIAQNRAQKSDLFIWNNWLCVR
jgi:hypothetical protein